MTPSRKEIIDHIAKVSLTWHSFLRSCMIVNLEQMKQLNLHFDKTKETIFSLIAMAIMLKNLSF